MEDLFEQKSFKQSSYVRYEINKKKWQNKVAWHMFLFTGHLYDSEV